MFVLDPPYDGVVDLQDPYGKEWTDDECVWGQEKSNNTERLGCQGQDPWVKKILTKESGVQQFPPKGQGKGIIDPPSRDR